MKMTIEINTDNDAFRGGDLGGQIAEILAELAYNVRQLSCNDTEFNYDCTFPLRDRNGNTVGQATHGEES